MNILASLNDSCSDYTLAATLNLVHNIINIMLVLVPIVLIMSLTILFIRMVTNPEDQKANKRLVNVLLAAILCFLLPTILNLVLSVLPDDVAGLDMAACWDSASQLDYDEGGQAIGSGTATNLGFNFETLRNAVGRGLSSSTWTPVGVTPCGQQNLAGVAVQCITPAETKGEEIANFALSFEGYPYVWGGSGEDLTSGVYNSLKATYPDSYYNDSKIAPFLDKGFKAWDCSGFTQYVFKQFNYQIPRNSQEQRQWGNPVASISEAQPGDLLANDHHVSIYVGNGKIVHAQCTDCGTVVSNVEAMGNVYDIRRIANENGFN